MGKVNRSSLSHNFPADGTKISHPIHSALGTVQCALVHSPNLPYILRRVPSSYILGFLFLSSLGKDDSTNLGGTDAFLLSTCAVGSLPFPPPVRPPLWVYVPKMRQLSLAPARTEERRNFFSPGLKTLLFLPCMKLLQKRNSYVDCCPKGTLFCIARILWIEKTTKNKHVGFPQKGRNQCDSRNRDPLS